MNENIITIAPGINAHITYFAPIKQGSDLFRTIFEVYATTPPSEAGKIFKEYEVWLTREVVEDKKRLKKGATNEDIKNFAKEFLKERYDRSGRQIPEEDGAFISNATNVVLGNPKMFPLEPSEKSKLLKTTIMIPEDVHKWLREYSYERSIGIGEAIRRVVMSFREEKKK